MKEILFYILILIFLIYNLVIDYDRGIRLRRLEKDTPVMIDNIIREDYPYLIRDLQDYDVLHSQAQNNSFILRKEFPDYEERLNAFRDYWQKPLSIKIVPKDSGSSMHLPKSFKWKTMWGIKEKE